MNWVWSTLCNLRGPFVVLVRGSYHHQNILLRSRETTTQKHQHPTVITILSFTWKTRRKKRWRRSCDQRTLSDKNDKTRERQQTTQPRYNAKTDCKTSWNMITKSFWFGKLMTELLGVKTASSVIPTLWTFSLRQLDEKHKSCLLSC